MTNFHILLEIYSDHYIYTQEQRNKNSIQDPQQYIQSSSIRKTKKKKIKRYIPFYK